MALEGQMGKIAEEGVKRAFAAVQNTLKPTPLKNTTPSMQPPQTNPVPQSSTQPVSEHTNSFTTHRPKVGEFLIFLLVLLVAGTGLFFFENTIVQRLLLIIVCGLLFAERFLGEKLEEKFNIQRESADPLLLWKLIVASLIVLYIKDFVLGIVLVLLFFLVVLYGATIIHKLKEHFTKYTKEKTIQVVAGSPALQHFWPKIITALILDIALDNTLGRLPALGILLDLIMAFIGSRMWGSIGWLQALELLDFTEQVDGFIPTLTIAGIVARISAKEETPSQTKTVLTKIFLILISTAIIIPAFMYLGLPETTTLGVGAVILAFFILIVIKPELGLKLIKTIGLLAAYVVGITALLIFGIPAGIVALVLLITPFIIVVVDVVAGSILLSALLITGIYAGMYGLPFPADSPLGKVTKTSVESMHTLITKAKTGRTSFDDEIKKRIAMASGDYAYAQIDKDAKKDLGVYLEELKTTEERILDTNDATFFSTIRAQTLDKPITIRTQCIQGAEKKPAKIIGPCKEPAEKECVIHVETQETADLDCVVPKENMKPGSNTLTLEAAFDFTTRSYLPVYMMDQNKLRELRRKNLDPLEGYDIKTPIATTTKGPVRVGIALGSQPVGVSLTPTTGPTIAVTIDNAWDGEIKSIQKLLLFVPKGVEITSITGGRAEGTPSKRSCNELPEEEQNRGLCDDKVTTVYEIKPGTLGQETFGTFVTIRAHTNIKEGSLLLGTTPVSLRYVRATVDYAYLLKKSKTFFVEGVST